jgi:DASS family divalent anion:Na+ symporter
MALKHSKTLKLLILFMGGTLMWFSPISNEISPQSWHLLVIFLFTIIGIILNPLPISALALLGAGSCVLFGVLDTKQVLSGFSDKVIWLLVFAFLISRAMIKTGLGKRMAYYFISKLGKTTLGLSYGLIFAEFLLSPAIPSVTARGGGIIYPIAQSLVSSYGTQRSPSCLKKTLGFISQVCFQANIITSAMFLTAMASNPLVQSLALKEGIEISWNTWALGAIVPGIISLALLPLSIYVLHKPAITISPDAPKHALTALKEMGKLSLHEIIMTITLAGLIIGWVLDKKIGLDATAVAMLGVITLLVTGVLDWNDAIHEKSAWDSFIWFAIMVTLSGQLAELGAIKWISGKIGSSLIGYPAAIAVPLLIALYFYLHYLFASAAAHIAVLFTTFLLLILSFNVPVMIAAMPLAYFSSLSGGLTHYGIATAPIYYGTKAVTTAEWWKIGLLISLQNIIIWGVIGGFWWKYLGWF